MTRHVRRAAIAYPEPLVALTVEERLVYKKALQSHPLWPAFMIATHAGLRLSELAHFSKQDVRNGIIIVKNKPEEGFTVKNYRARRIPVEDELKNVIALLPETGPALTTHRGERWDPTALGKRWVKTIEKLQLPPERRRRMRPTAKAASSGPTWKMIHGVRMHELRHTYASIQMQEKTTDIYTLMRRMGHSSITTTQGYFHLFNP